MASVRAGLVLVWCLLAVSAPARRAEAGKAEEVREYLERATAAYALGHYAAAAESFEKAFALKPDPAVLYNAAQAHRLGGNKQRALELYQSYLRVYGKKEKRAEIEARVKELARAIEADRKLASAPPTTTQPVAVPPAEAPAATPAPASPPATPAATPPAPPAPPPQPAPQPAAPPPAATPAPVTRAPDAPAPASSAPVLVSQPAAPPDEDRPLTSRPVFWVALGAVVVAGAAVAVVLATRGPKDPTPTIGSAPGF